MMTAPDQRLSFGIKTSQMGLGYEEIQRIWREADQIPVFGHAWLWDHMVPLRGEIAREPPWRPGHSSPPWPGATTGCGWASS